MALNLFPKLPPLTQVALIISIAFIGAVALIVGNQDAFNAIIVNNFLVHSGLIGQSFYEVRQISQGKIIQGVSPGALGYTPEKNKPVESSTKVD